MHLVPAPPTKYNPDTIVYIGFREYCLFGHLGDVEGHVTIVLANLPELVSD